MKNGQNTGEKRKQDHLDLAFRAQVSPDKRLKGLNYEPLFASHPSGEERPFFPFLGKEMKAPFWISSMTGGVGPARQVNQNLARAVGEFGLGMGLGSIRPLLESKTYFEDFNLRPILGAKAPFYANLGIAQIEQYIAGGRLQKINDLVCSLEADGLIIHINILQEWLQPEGDKLLHPPLETLQKFLEKAPYPVVVKEVGQGLGPRSLKALMGLPLAAVEFGAFGGTNFSRLELIRQNSGEGEQRRGDFALIGHTAEEMVEEVNKILQESSSCCVENFIISGGIKSVLEGYRLNQKCLGQSVIGRASAYLKAAYSSYDNLRDFIEKDLEELMFAQSFVQVK